MVHLGPHATEEEPSAVHFCMVCALGDCVSTFSSVGHHGRLVGWILAPTQQESPSFVSPRRGEFPFVEFCFSWRLAAFKPHSDASCF
mmetsp:Transcript_6500/g.18212  ORF Transcript_6500/g.18212 Transcript_6500/m.18212 type:complete len:87 (-) Transcript_6500:52-312(-)